MIYTLVLVPTQITVDLSQAAVHVKNAFEKENKSVEIFRLLQQQNQPGPKQMGAQQQQPQSGGTPQQRPPRGATGSI